MAKKSTTTQWEIVYKKAIQLIAQSDCLTAIPLLKQIPEEALQFSRARFYLVRCAIQIDQTEVAEHASRKISHDALSPEQRFLLHYHHETDFLSPQQEWMRHDWTLQTALKMGSYPQSINLADFNEVLFEASYATDFRSYRAHYRRLALDPSPRANQTHQQFSVSGVFKGRSGFAAEWSTYFLSNNQDSSNGAWAWELSPFFYFNSESKLGIRAHYSHYANFGPGNLHILQLTPTLRMDLSDWLGFRRFFVETSALWNQPYFNFIKSDSTLQSLLVSHWSTQFNLGAEWESLSMGLEYWTGSRALAVTSAGFNLVSTLGTWKNGVETQVGWKISASGLLKGAVRYESLIENLDTASALKTSVTTYIFGIQLNI